jgi:hypothetical protein
MQKIIGAEKKLENGFFYSASSYLLILTLLREQYDFEKGHRGVFPHSEKIWVFLTRF